MRRKGATEDRTERVFMRATPTLRRTIEGFAQDLGEHLQRPITMTEALEVAVNSSAAALAGGQLPTALAHPPGALPAPRGDRTR